MTKAEENSAKPISSGNRWLGLFQASLVLFGTSGGKRALAAAPIQTAEVGMVAALALVLGPELGNYALIVFGALIGTMHSVSKIDFGDSKIQAAMYMLRWIGAACILTSFVSSLIKTYAGFPADRWPGVVAFGITFLADKWPGWASDFGSAWVRFRAPQTPKDPQ